MLREREKVRMCMENDGRNDFKRNWDHLQEMSRKFYTKPSNLPSYLPVPDVVRNHLKSDFTHEFKELEKAQKKLLLVNKSMQKPLKLKFENLQKVVKKSRRGIKLLEKVVMHDYQKAKYDQLKEIMTERKNQN